MYSPETVSDVFLDVCKDGQGLAASGEGFQQSKIFFADPIPNSIFCPQVPFEWLVAFGFPQEQKLEKSKH